jgi:putative transposase
MIGPIRRTARLRWARISIPGAGYFLTICTRHREPVLTRPRWAGQIESALLELHAVGDIELHAATIMPDHVHLLFILGSRLPVGRVIAKFKTLAREKDFAAWRWQQDGFERRLRPEDSEEDYGFYIFMNPYRACLLSTAQRWPWWVCLEPARFLFTQHLNDDGTPPIEWLEKASDVAKRIVAGE